jgi:hypothetical protein
MLISFGVIYIYSLVKLTMARHILMEIIINFSYISMYLCMVFYTDAFYATAASAMQ